MRSLRFRLIVLIALLMAIVSMVIAVLVYDQMKNGMIEGVDHELSGTASGYSTFVHSWYEDKMEAVHSGKTVVDSVDPVPLLARINQGGDFAVTYIGYADHHAVYSDGHKQPNGYDPVQRPWYQRVARSGQPGVSDPYTDFDTGKLCLTFALPVYNGATLKAVFASDVRIDALVKTVLSIKMRGNGFAFLVDKKGNVIAHPNLQLTLKPLTQSAPQLSAERLGAAAQSGETLQVDMDGKSMYVQIVPVTGTPWLIGVAMETTVVSNPMTKVLLTIVGIVLAAMIVLIPLAGMALGGMLKGLQRLSQAMSEISQGEGDLTRRIEVRGHDEIAATATAFNTFIDHLQNMFRAVKIEADRVIEGVDAVGGTVRHMTHDSREISDVSSANAATLEQITVSISHIATTAHEADSLVHHTRQISSDSATDMEKISQEMARTVEAVKGLSSMLSSLDMRSQQITGITNVIKDIADQTNLLALNAAIEAARAGEMGRGFAVVADEVRKLAERTAQATLEITTMVTTIREETGQALGNMRRTVNSVDGGVQLTQEAVARIATIGVEMNGVVSKMNDISLSTDEQHKATTMIAQSTEQMNGRIRDNDGALQEVHQNLSQLGEAAARMHQMFTRFHV